MKKTPFLLAIMLTSSLLVTACNRGSSDNPADSGGGTATGSGTMSATVDGQSWTATLVSAGYTNNSLAVTGSQVQGTSASTLTITIANVTGTGEFRLGLLPGVGGVQGVATYGIGTGAGSNAQGWVTTNTEAGTVNITRLDVPNKTVAGTFSFRCSNPNATPAIRNITNGRFEARWQ